MKKCPFYRGCPAKKGFRNVEGLSRLVDLLCKGEFQKCEYYLWKMNNK